MYCDGQILVLMFFWERLEVTWCDYGLVLERNRSDLSVVFFCDGLETDEQ